MPLNSTRGAGSAKGFGLTAGAKKFEGNLDVLVVAGGGSGGSPFHGGGGGAGGVILYPAIPVTIDSSGVPITIGGGASFPSLGNDSVFGYTSTPLTAKGGGKGGPDSPFNGGSGGGARGGLSGDTQGGSTIQVPSMPAPLQPFGFGNNGGNAPNSVFPHLGAGGGGGGSGTGGTGSPSAGGQGGSGKDVSPVFGASPQTYYGPTGAIYAGGGGGSAYATGGASGGSGGGGSGGSDSSPAGGGTVNSGGGGGGLERNPTNNGAGGSGFVLVKAPSTATVSVSPGTNTVTSTPTGKFAKFTVSGTLNIS